jgi:hypothetical protein
LGIAEKIISAAVNLIRSGFEDGVDDGAAGPSKFRLGDAGLHSLNSSIASVEGKKTIVLTRESLLSMPSNRKLLACGRAPDYAQVLCVKLPKETDEEKYE